VTLHAKIAVPDLQHVPNDVNRCKSAIAILARRVPWNYAYSPIKDLKDLKLIYESEYHCAINLKIYFVKLLL